jgi:hypothetical protein
MLCAANNKLQYELPAMLNGIMNNPGEDGVPDAVSVRLPEPTLNVPAGVLIVTPFTATLVNAGYVPPGLFT